MQQYRSGLLTRKLVEALTGVIIGILYYFIYVVFFPGLFQKISIVTRALSPISVVMLLILVLLGILERVLPKLPTSLSRLLSKLVGAGYLYSVTNGGVVQGNVGESYVILDASILVYIIVIFTLFIGVLDASGMITSYSDRR